MRAFTVLPGPDEEAGGYTVTVSAFPGCITQGDSFEEALAAGATHLDPALPDATNGIFWSAERGHRDVAGG